MAYSEQPFSDIAAGDHVVKVDNIKALYAAMKRELGGTGWYWGEAELQEDGTLSFDSWGAAYHDRDIYLNTTTGKAYVYMSGKWQDFVTFSLSSSGSPTPEIGEKPNLSELQSYDQMKQLADRIASCLDASEYEYLIGQSINVPISGYGTYTFTVVDVKHDGTDDGHFTGMTFMADNVITNHAYGDDTAPFVGWGGSSIKTFMNDSLLSAFPVDLQNIIEEVDKTYEYFNAGALSTPVIGTSKCKLFVPSYMELGHTEPGGFYNMSNIGSVYRYFETNTNLVRNFKNGSATRWWIRDVCTHKTSGSGGSSTRSYGCIISASGAFQEWLTNNQDGVIPMFAIGSDSE